MNRDTLYSFATVDISEPATITIPEHGERYVSVTVVNEDHYINDIFHEAGAHEISIDRFDTPDVAVAARVLVDPTDPDDLTEVHRIQDVSSSSSQRPARSRCRTTTKPTSTPLAKPC